MKLEINLEVTRTQKNLKNHNLRNQITEGKFVTVTADSSKKTDQMLNATSALQLKQFLVKDESFGTDNNH